MIDISTGRDVERLLESAIARPDRFSDVALCAPFVDERMIDRIAQLAVATRGAACGFRIVTSTAAASALLARLPQPGAFWRQAVVANDRVHAKVYVVTPRGRGVARAIVTSANLTWRGVAGNLELGVSATSATPQGSHVVRAAREFIGRLAA
jgi:phosphatidylserine/phosphatidylglycerophosphate/cardiolipin synthase-like enzyme